jgi:hypothetical protein
MEMGSEESIKRLNQRRSTIKPFDLPIETDILQNLPHFCFPSKLKLILFMIGFENCLF